MYAVLTLGYVSLRFTCWKWAGGSVVRCLGCFYETKGSGSKLDENLKLWILLFEASSYNEIQ